MLYLSTALHLAHVPPISQQPHQVLVMLLKQLHTCYTFHWSNACTMSFSAHSLSLLRTCLASSSKAYPHTHSPHHRVCSCAEWLGSTEALRSCSLPPDLVTKALNHYYKFAIAMRLKLTIAMLRCDLRATTALIPVEDVGGEDEALY